MGSGAASVWLPAGRLLFAGISGTYLALVLAFAGRTTRSHGIRCGSALAAAFPVLHFSYGLGFLTSIARRLAGMNRGSHSVAAVTLSR